MLTKRELISLVVRNKIWVNTYKMISFELMKKMSLMVCHWLEEIFMKKIRSFSNKHKTLRVLSWLRITVVVCESSYLSWAWLSLTPQDLKRKRCFSWNVGEMMWLKCQLMMCTQMQLSPFPSRNRKTQGPHVGFTRKANLGMSRLML